MNITVFDKAVCAWPSWSAVNPLLTRDRQGRSSILAESPRFTREERLQTKQIVNHDKRHDDRVKAIVNSGYNLEETIIALRATKEFGMESTKRAGEYLRRNSKTPIPSIEKRL